MARSPGRPPKLTRQAGEAIVKAIRRGNPPELAGALVGVSRATFYRWLKRGHREPETRYGWFLRHITQALADAESRDVALISDAAKKDWRAAAWMLARRFPERWGPKQPCAECNRRNKDRPRGRMRKVRG